MKMLSRPGIILSFLKQEWRELFEQIERQGFVIDWPNDGDTMLIKHKQIPSVVLCLSRHATDRWVVTASAWHMVNDLGTWSAISSDDTFIISEIEQILDKSLKWAQGVGVAA